MIQIIALLYAGQHGIKGLREFESLAIPILKEHGGVLVSASSKMDRADTEPDEIHVIQFPSNIEFDAYKSDKRIIEMATFREEMIDRMEIYLTTNFHEY